jgi:hypothetical protein
MTRILMLLLALGLAGACSTGDGSNPFDEEETAEDGDGEGGDAGGDAGEPIESDRTLPPGTANPAPDRSIFRREAFDAENGAGYAESISYDSTADVFYVDNLAFDGNNAYARDDQRPSLDTAPAGGRADAGRFAVYENANPILDTLNTEPIDQLPHKAIYAVSQSGETEFAIVRTGAYINYGFGGFVYQRNGTDAAGNPVSVTLPTEGQANYQGEYAGLRDFQGRSGLEYVTGDMRMAIDFEDFNDPTGVRGEITNRRVYDAFSNNEITTDLVTALNQDGGSFTQLPTLLFRVGPGVLDENGEITGQAFSSDVTNTQVEVYEEGNYYAVLSGPDADEVVGIVVVESEDPRFTGITARETGGFIATR